MSPIPASPDAIETEYRADIDGLRAVAVVPVVFYHAWPKWIPGGFVGVDIFFVISGFLITSIILSQLAAGTFSILGFYARRVRRIFPALFIVLLTAIAAGWGVLLHDEFRQIGKHVIAGAAFVSNLMLWHESGYFDNAAATKPLLHLWSLGVEEQFYIAWPIILWVVFTRRINWFNFLLVAGMIFALSMGANMLTVGINPSAAFFSPVTRFWELMAGGIAAYCQLYRNTWNARRRMAASMTGGALLVAAFWLIKPQTPFPGAWALLPVCGTFLIIMAGPLATVNRLMLGRAPMTWIGLISYPLYLWHWPLLSFSYILYGEKPPFQAKIALVFAAVVLAFLTYRLVEAPLRASRAKKTVVAALSGAIAAMAAVGLMVNLGFVRERIDVHGADIYLAALNDSDYPGKTMVPLEYKGIAFQKVPSGGPGLTVFLGDSVVQQYGPRIEMLLASQPSKFNQVIFATAGGCPPVPHLVVLPQFKYPLCTRTVHAAYELANRADVDTVVVGAAWYGYFGAGQGNLIYDDDIVRYAFPDFAALEKSYSALQKALSTLGRNGKRVFLILQPPAGREFDPKEMFAGSRFADIRPLETIRDLDLEKFRGENAPVRTRLIGIARETGAIVIEPASYLCKNGRCPVRGGDGAPLYTDGMHMRPSYTRSAATFLDQTITAVPGRK